MNNETISKITEGCLVGILGGYIYNTYNSFFVAIASVAIAAFLLRVREL